jgi:hypothetical protein
MQRFTAFYGANDTGDFPKLVAGKVHLLVRPRFFSAETRIRHLPFSKRPRDFGVPGHVSIRIAGEVPKAQRVTLNTHRRGKNAFSVEQVCGTGEKWLPAYTPWPQRRITARYLHQR